MRLDRLPEQISLSDATRLGARPTTGKHVLLGVSGDRLSPVWVSLDAGPLVIAGPAAPAEAGAEVVTSGEVADALVP